VTTADDNINISILYTGGAPDCERPVIQAPAWVAGLKFGVVSVMTHR